jgi:hypothetical protein
MEKQDLIKELSVYGKVEILEVTDEQVEVKITDGFTGRYEPTMRVGEIVLNAYPKFKNVKKAQTDIGLCHYIFN